MKVKYLFGSIVLGAFVVIAWLLVQEQLRGHADESRPTQHALSTRPSTAEERMSKEEAKRVISEYAASARFSSEPKVTRDGLKTVGVGWPEVPPKVARALVAIKGLNDPDVNADLAALLVRYEKEVQRIYWGGFPRRVQEHPVTEAFFSAVKPDLYEYDVRDWGFISTHAAEWICKNRDKLGKSATLDREIEEYKTLMEDKKRNPEKYYGPPSPPGAKSVEETLRGL